MGGRQGANSARIDRLQQKLFPEEGLRDAPVVPAAASGRGRSSARRAHQRSAGRGRRLLPAPALHRGRRPGPDRHAPRAKRLFRRGARRQGRPDDRLRRRPLPQRDRHRDRFLARRSLSRQAITAPKWRKPCSTGCATSSPSGASSPNARARIRPRGGCCTGSASRRARARPRARAPGSWFSRRHAVVELTGLPARCLLRGASFAARLRFSQRIMERATMTEANSWNAGRPAVYPLAPLPASALRRRAAAAHFRDHARPDPGLAAVLRDLFRCSAC